MRLRGLMLIVLLGLAATNAAPVPAATKRCGPTTGARTIVQTADVRVTFKQADGVGSTYACWRSRRTVRVDRSTCSPCSVPAVNVRGPYVGLLRGGRAFALADARRGRPVKPHTGGPVGSWDLRQDGTLAWGESGPASRVHTVRPGGQPTTLDEDPGVDPTSVALGRSAIYWTRDDQPRSAGIALGPDPSDVTQTLGPVTTACGPRRAHTRLLYFDRNVRVTYKADSQDAFEKVYGCWRKGNAQVIFDESCDADTGCDPGPTVSVVGPHVGYERRGCTRGAPGCTTVLGVRDLQRRLLTKFVAADVAGYSLAANGTAVWAESPDEFGQPTGPWSMRALPLSGQVIGLDRGDDVYPVSVAVGSTRAYWTTRSGEPRSALIP